LRDEVLLPSEVLGRSEFVPVMAVMHEKKVVEAVSIGRMVGC